MEQTYQLDEFLDGKVYLAITVSAGGSEFSG